MTSNTTKNIIGAIVAALGIVGGAIGFTSIPASDTEPAPAIEVVPSMAPTLEIEVTPAEAAECFNGGGNYRFGNACVPVNVK